MEKDNKDRFKEMETKLQDRSKELQLEKDKAERCVKELNSKEEQVQKREMQLKNMRKDNEDRSKELDLLQDSIDKRAENLKMKALRLERLEKELVSREEHVGMDNHTEMRCKKLENEVQYLFKKVELLLEKQEGKDFFPKEEMVEQGEEIFKELKKVAIQVEDRFTELYFTRDAMKRWEQELISREEEIEKRVEQLKNTQKFEKELQVKLKIKPQGLDAAQQLTDKRVNEIHLRDEKINSGSRKWSAVTSPTQTPASSKKKSVKEDEWYLSVPLIVLSENDECN